MKKFILFSIFYFLFFAPQAEAAILYSQAANQDVYQGQSFVLDWFLDTEGESINTVDLKINFSPSTLEAVQVTKGNSLLSLWIKNPATDNSAGHIELIGGVPNGITHNKVPIFRTEFRAKAAGESVISLNADSVVLKNDGLGSTQAIKYNSQIFNVYPENFIPIKISSSTHPEQSNWYTHKDVSINFSPKAKEEYSYIFSSNIDVIPDDKVDDVRGAIEYLNRPDGIYYFKLNSKTGSDSWQEAGIYRVQIDSTPPESFFPIISSDGSVYDGSSFVSFSTLDKMSGISHYKVRNGLFGMAKIANSPLKLKKSLIGDKIEITAVDLAGNENKVSVDYKGYISTTVFVIGLIVLGASLIIFYAYRRRRTEPQ